MENAIAQAFSDGSIVDGILIFVVAEFVILLALRRYVHDLKIADVVTLMLPGIFLMLALRSALEKADWKIVAGWLLASLIAHLGDLAMRARNQSSNSLRASKFVGR
jgi:hypothetical protein